MIVTCLLAFGEFGVRERVRSVLNYRKPTFWIITVAVIACAVIGVYFLTNPKTSSVEENADATNSAETEKTTVDSSALTDIFSTVIDEETPVRLVLIVDQDMVIGDHNGWGCANDVQCSSSLLDYSYETATPEKMQITDNMIYLMSTAEGGRLDAPFL